MTQNKMTNEEYAHPYHVEIPFVRFGFPLIKEQSEQNLKHQWIKYY